MIKYFDKRAFLKLFGASGATVLLAAPANAKAARERTLLLETYIAGVPHYDAKNVLPDLPEGSRLKLRREPDNDYDENAIELLTADGSAKLGYVPRKHNEVIANLMDSGDAVTADLVYARRPFDYETCIRIWREQE